MTNFFFNLSSVFVFFFLFDYLYVLLRDVNEFSIPNEVITYLRLLFLQIKQIIFVLTHYFILIHYRPTESTFQSSENSINDVCSPN